MGVPPFMDAFGAKRKTLSFAHLSDVHLEAGGPSAERFAACLDRIRNHPSKPEFILGGGDMIMDAMAAPRERVRGQWDLFHKTVSQAGAPPWLHCIGNHDIFGWNHAESGASGAEKDYGKAWAIDELGLPGRFYSVDAAGWHLIVLDSVHAWGRPGAGLGQALIDSEQFEWLIGDLASVRPTTPVLVLSHHPFRSTIGYHEHPPHAKLDGDWTTVNAWLHMDTLVIEPIFALHGNVRLALSGHMHRRSRMEHERIEHIGSGAVSGNFWRGGRPDRPESCGIGQLFEDGTIAYEWLDL